MEQQKIDKLMIEMDGTENKCEWPEVGSLPGRLRLLLKTLEVLWGEVLSSLTMNYVTVCGPPLTLIKHVFEYQEHSQPTAAGMQAYSEEARALYNRAICGIFQSPMDQRKGFLFGGKSSLCGRLLHFWCEYAKELERKRFRIQSRVHTVVQVGAASRRKAGE